jgi:hypothetical protein
MARSTKSAWLEGPGDLKEADVEDVPVKGQSVRVRSLPASYSNQAASEGLRWETGEHGVQTSTIDTQKMEVLQFAGGCIDPEFTVEEAQAISERYGQAFKRVVEKINELSGINPEAVKETNARFRSQRESAPGADLGNGTAAGSGRSDVHSGAKSGAGNPGG